MIVPIKIILKVQAALALGAIVAVALFQEDPFLLGTFIVSTFGAHV